MNWRTVTIIICTAAYTSLWWAVAHFGWWWGGEHTPQTSFPAVGLVVVSTIGLLLCLITNACHHWDD